MHRVVLVLAAAFAVAARPAAGQVYKCVDADGRVTYQQTACARADRGGPVDLILDNGSARDTPEIEARWKTLADRHDVVAGMPKRWVQTSLGLPAEVRPGAAGESAGEVWSYPSGAQVRRIGFRGNLVAWSRAEPAGAERAPAPAAPPTAPASTIATAAGGEQAEALRSRVAAERSCEEVLAELGAPAGQEATRVTVGTGGTLRSADALRYTYEPLPNGLPARLSFVCVDGKVVSVARDVAR